MNVGWYESKSISKKNLSKLQNSSPKGCSQGCL